MPECHMRACDDLCALFIHGFHDEDLVTSFGQDLIPSLIYSFGFRSASFRYGVYICCSECNVWRWSLMILVVVSFC